MLILVQGDITKQPVDCIVNAANCSLLGGGGVDGAIHREGGPDILSECLNLRRTLYKYGLPTGEAVATGAGRLPAKLILHTVGPNYTQSANPRLELVRSYRSCCRLAFERGMKSIAFPSISTGAYGYPTSEAAPIALKAVWYWKNTLDIRFVLFSVEDLNTYQSALEEIYAQEETTRP